METKKRPSILIVNDDGIFAPGIKFLTEAACKFGEVLVVAPDAPRSGQSHAITLASPLRLQEAGVENGVRRFSCNGTPADCVKMAVKVILRGEHPDYVFSGINHGSNAASNAIYSGTIAGIVEGALSGVPSVGFSLLDHSLHADFKPIMPYVEKIMKACIESGRKDICWNVNFPRLPEGDIKGIKVCHAAEAVWKEDAWEREDPTGRKYYWITGEFENTDLRKSTDLYYLEQGYVSLVPLKVDWTDYDEMERLQKDLKL